MVLLKSIDARGFVFYTNYDSPKACRLAENPEAELVWWWEPLRRQVRVTGRASKVSVAESDAYFATRERASQLAAWASRQSQTLSHRTTLDEQVAVAESRFAGAPVPRPPWWGGLLVKPNSVEFWQGRAHRLHDRLRYIADADGWRIERLAP